MLSFQEASAGEMPMRARNLSAVVSDRIVGSETYWLALTLRLIQAFRPLADRGAGAIENEV